MTALDLPTVDPMMVRKIIPRPETQFGYYGGVLVFDVYDVEPVGLVETRLEYDEPVVDCSNRIFQITTEMMIIGGDLAWTAFTSRRWRNFRVGEHLTAHPTTNDPLLYLGNPVRLIRNDSGIHVISGAEFLIKSGVELGY